jgi:hypothetical protein
VSARLPRPADVTIPPAHRLARLPLVGGGTVALVSLGYASTQWGSEQFLFSWLVAFMFWLSIGLGAMFFVLTHYVTKASWSVVVRRIGENLMLPLPLMFLLFVPIWLGRQRVFHWLEPGAAEHDALLRAKAWWLTDGFWSARWLVYFAVWTLLVAWLCRRSRAQDRGADPRVTRRLIQLSAPALILFALSTTGAAIDWIMSLDPHWYSTMFGVYYFAGAFVGFAAVMAIVTVVLRGGGVLGGAVTVEHLHDLGKLLFAFTVFWAYIAFSQYFLIWYGNIPEETVFYLHRSQGGWKTLSALLAAGHFVVPFFFLMSYKVKRSPALLVTGATWMAAMHYLDIYWLIMPVLHEHDVHFHALDVAAFAGIGGLWLALAGWAMTRGPLVPLGDPRLERSLSFENA